MSDQGGARTSMRYHRALSLVFGRPLALSDLATHEVLAAINRRIGVEVSVVNVMGEALSVEAAARPTRRELRSVARTPGFDAASGVYTIAIHDKLVQRRSTMDAECGLTCYDVIGEQVEAARHPDVKGVWLWDDSPGGQAAGMIQLGDEILSLAKEKPVVAWVDELAASAGYGLIAGASSIWGPSTLEAGSIGVRWLHISQAAAVEAEGLKVTEFTSGRKKTWGSPFADLTEESAKYIQAQIDTLADAFFGLVKRGRKMALGAIRDLEGGLLIGKAALDAGLVDHIGTREDALAHLFDLMNERKRSSLTPVSTGAVGAPDARAAARAMEPPMHKTLFAALLLLPACSAMTSEAVETDEGAAAAAAAIRAAQEGAARAASLDAQLKLLQSQGAATQAEITAAQQRLTEANARAASLESQVRLLTAQAEESAWTAALAGVKADHRQDVRAEAMRTRAEGQTPAQAVDGLRTHSVWGLAFAAPRLDAADVKALDAAGRPVDVGNVEQASGPRNIGR